ncbi:hypothetical protein ACP70R_039252 [Stipagrostis hirtigluma subsp. patula]
MGEAASTGVEYFVVVHFEATCERSDAPRIYPQEIIEFPAVLVGAATGRVLSEFRTYVRPRHHPRLTAYCVELTGIQQRQVDAGVELREALAMHGAWLQASGAADESRLAVVTWGDWDCATMLDSECRFKGLAKPACFDRWVNLRVPFDATFGLGAGGRRRDLPEAVRAAGLQWQGRWHCGLDDARNTARLLAELMRRGVAIQITGSLPPAPPVSPPPSSAPQPQPVVVVPWGGASAAACCCYCGVASRGGAFVTPGTVQGRRFYMCGNWTPEFGATCHSFLWAALRWPDSGHVHHRQDFDR